MEEAFPTKVPKKKKEELKEFSRTQHRIIFECVAIRIANQGKGSDYHRQMSIR